MYRNVYSFNLTLNQIHTNTLYVDIIMYFSHKHELETDRARSNMLIKNEDC